MDTKNPINENAMYDVMCSILRGEKDSAWIESFLRSLSTRGETVDELTGAARALRDMAEPIDAPAHAIDCCGTGGDQKGTYNISTAVALVAAACGVPIAKHGNRASSSKSGAADVLEAMGVNLNSSKTLLESALHDLNFAFLMAPNHHPGMKHVAEARKNINERTLFNLLGPLANPAKTKRQLIGVFDHAYLEPLAQVLKNLGTETAWLVSSSDGLDEISISGGTHVCILDTEGHITHQTIMPEDFGLMRRPMDKILGGDAAENADALWGLLEGKEGAYLDIVLANTAAVLIIANKVKTLIEGIDTARSAIKSKSALNGLKKYIDLTQKEEKLNEYTR